VRRCCTSGRRRCDDISTPSARTIQPLTSCPITLPRSMPVWQWDATARTCTRWRYSLSGSRVPVCSEVWTGVESEAAAVRALRRSDGSSSRLVQVIECHPKNNT